MNEPTAPWRALEASPAPGGTADPAPPGAPVDRRVLATVAALVAAALIAAVAVWLVAASGRGSVAIDGPVARDSGLSGDAVAVPSGDSGDGLLVVDVQGAVVHPGVVRLAPGSRVGDAIGAAGGFGPRVASDRLAGALNLAALVRDGDQVVVPSRDDPATGGTSVGPSSPGSGLVDLNHANATELDALPGVGPATAAKIIAAREEQPFASVADLQTRKVVGAATFEKLKDLVTVR